MLSALRSLSLEQQEIERVPELVRFAPNLEVLSLSNCGGFLEHEAIKRLPKLRDLYVHGSTLARFPKQIEPQLRTRPGLTIHGA